MLISTLEQIQKDNIEENKDEKGIAIDNTKGKESK
jgi:hypothetical protein